MPLVSRALLLYLHLLSIPAAAQDQRKAGDVVIEPASIELPNDGGKIEYEVGTLHVPENRAEPKSRIIGVGFARFKAAERGDTPPMFMLPGGPGGSYLSDLKPGSLHKSGLLKMVAEQRSFGDVVLVDQRGHSERGDVLTFKHRSASLPFDEPVTIERSTSAFAETARAAVAEFATRGIDLRGYTVKECADDVNDLRKALGYQQISLVGGSFGSQWSFAVMRRHPDIVARALLTGVEPIDHGYDMPSHVMAAVQRMWREAEEDPGLKPHLPPGGLMAAAREVLRRLENKPITVPLKGVKDPKTGEAATIVLGPEEFQRDAFLRGSAGPAFVLSLLHENYDSWAFEASVRRRSRMTEMPLIGPLIDTSLGVTPKREYLLRNDPATAFLGQWNFYSYLVTADIWPTADVGDDFRTDVVTPIPVVFVHGDWDTQTPIENTLQIAPFFPKSHVVIVEHGGHGAMNQVAQHQPNVMAALMSFLKTGDASKLPTRVTVPVPKFNVPSFPTQSR